MTTRVRIAGLALIILATGAALAAEPEGPPGWYLEGSEDLGVSGPYEADDCKTAFRTAEFGLHQKYPGHNAWNLTCTYYGPYYRVMVDIAHVGWDYAGGPMFMETLKECREWLDSSSFKSDATETYYCSRRGPDDEVWSGSDY